MKKILIALGIVLVLIVGGLMWWHQHHRDNILVLHGNVDIRQISLAFDGSGRILTLQVDEGDRVKAGDVLGMLDTQTLALEAKQAAAQIKVQQQNLLRMHHGSRPEEIAQAHSRLEAAQADAVRASQDLKRLQGVAANTQGQGVSKQELDQLKSADQMAKAQVKEQRNALRLSQLGPRKEDVDGAQAQLEAAQAQLALLQHQIAQGELKAPADAVVRSRLLEPGDMATPQRPVLSLALMHPKWVRVYVSEPDLGKVKPGMSARVTTDSAPDKPIAGKVGYISSVAEFTPKSVQTEELRTNLVYEVRVLVDDPSNALRLGQPATVKLAGETQ